MKKLLASLVLMGAASAIQAAPVTVSFLPATSHIAVGGATTVEMRISGLGDEILSSFDADMLFNSSVLSNYAVTHNAVPQMGGLGNVFFSSTFTPGMTESIDYSLLTDAELAAAQANDFAVLTFSFTGLADGFSLVNLGADLDFERNFVGLNYGTLDVTVQGACISVGTGACEVPEPGAYSLAGVALLAAGWAGRRRTRKTAV